MSFTESALVELEFVAVALIGVSFALASSGLLDFFH